MKILTVLFALLLALPGIALALEGKLVSASGDVILWRSKAAMDEGQALIRARAPELAVPLATCAVKNGTRAMTTVKTDGSMWSGYALAVTVIEGPYAGCRGFVRLHEFKDQ